MKIVSNNQNFESATFSNELSPAAELSLKYYRNGLYCSEAILRAFNETYNLGLPENVYKISTGFGSGLGESGCACGTVTGAAMVLGLAAGRNKSYESEKDVYLAIKKLHDRFRAEHKAVCCRVLTKSFIWKSKQHKKHCERYVIDSASWTDEILKTQLIEYMSPGRIKKISIKKIIKYVFSRLRGRNY